MNNEKQFKRRIKYIIAVPIALAIILCGFMGCGKTTLGKMLAEQLNMEFLDIDKIIEDKQNLKISEIFENWGEFYFRSLESIAVNDIYKLKNKIISLGGGTLENPENVQKLKSNGIIFFLDVPLNVIEKRLQDDKIRPLLKSQNIESLFFNRLQNYKKYSDFTLNANLEPQEICSEIISLLKIKP